MDTLNIPSNFYELRRCINAAQTTRCIDDGTELTLNESTARFLFQRGMPCVAQQTQKRLFRTTSWSGKKLIPKRQYKVQNAFEESLIRPVQPTFTKLVFILLPLRCQRWSWKHGQIPRSLNNILCSSQTDHGIKCYKSLRIFKLDW